MASNDDLHEYGEARVPLPRIAIKFCTQCKWNLRAAYFAQELLSTFSTSIGEVSLIPVTGGTFTITLLHRPPLQPESPPTTFPDTRYLPRPNVTEHLVWDRKAEGGFPETKELKNRVRNIIEPNRDLGHTDRALKKSRISDEQARTPMSNQSATEATPQASSKTVSPLFGIPATEGLAIVHGASKDDAIMIDQTPTTEKQDPCDDCQ